MDIAWFRDLVICIWGLIGTLVLIFMAIIIFLFYRKMKVVLDSVEMTSATIHRISSMVGDEVIKPITQVVSLVQGIRQGIDFITKYFKKE